MTLDPAQSIGRRRRQIVTAARACLGTPFHHQGRQPSRGLDCLGLVAIAYRSAGFLFSDRQDYPRLPKANELVDGLLAAGLRPCDHMSEGDVLLFRIGNRLTHVGLVTDHGVIHSFQPSGGVVEHRLSMAWQRRLETRYCHDQLFNSQERH